MTATVRVGIIGTGFGATTVAPAFRQAPDCEVVDVVTPRDAAAVAALCRRPDVDLISVHSPPFLHVEHIGLAVSASKAVLCDKPFGVTVADAEAMTESAERASVVNLLNFERRYDPLRLAVKEQIERGAIGTPDHFQYSRFTALPKPLPFGWLDRRELGGGWLAGQGSHLIDASRWLFGEVVAAAAMRRTFVPERVTADGVAHACDADNGFVATLATERGVTAVIDCAVEAAIGRPEVTRVWGSGGMIEIDGTDVVVTPREGEQQRLTIDLAGRTPLVASMERFAEVACDSVRAGVAASGVPTFADGLACSRVMESMGR